jgi:tyrosyl-tRNA synthetase
MQSAEGMSFAEFCYPVLQAYDWWHMYRADRVQLQIGGADQYGNILSGVDGIKNAIKLHNQKHMPAPGGNDQFNGEFATPMGFTVPLLTTPSGEKFGKSAGNAVWLDKEQTSVFDLYGVGVTVTVMSTLLTNILVLRRSARF